MECGGGGGTCATLAAPKLARGVFAAGGAKPPPPPPPPPPPTLGRPAVNDPWPPACLLAAEEEDGASRGELATASMPPSRGEATGVAPVRSRGTENGVPLIAPPLEDDLPGEHSSALGMAQPHSSSMCPTVRGFVSVSTSAL